MVSHIRNSRIHCVVHHCGQFIQAYQRIAVTDVCRRQISGIETRAVNSLPGTDGTEIRRSEWTGNKERVQVDVTGSRPGCVPLNTRVVYYGIPRGQKHFFNGIPPDDAVRDHRIRGPAADSRSNIALIGGECATDNHGITRIHADAASEILGPVVDEKTVEK